MVFTTEQHCLSEAKEEMMQIGMLKALKIPEVLRLKPTSFLVLHGREKPSHVRASFKTSNIFFKA